MKESEMVENDLVISRKNLITKILSLPAVYCPEVFADFTVRGQDVTKVEWNEKMIRDPGMETQRLWDIRILTENRIERKA